MPTTIIFFLSRLKQVNIVIEPLKQSNALHKVKSGIDWIQSLLFRAAPLSPSIVLRHVLFGFSPDELLVVPRVFVYLLHSLKFLVWSQRNDCRFRSSRPGAVALLAALKARLRFYLPLFFKRFVSPRRKRYFLRHWGASGVVCSTTCGELVFHL